MDSRAAWAMRRVFLLVAFILLLSGCSSHSGNTMLGTTSYNYSLSEQREALRTVAVAQALPDDAVNMGPVDAARCHRNSLDAEPTEDMILTDLRMFAYAKGADGIYDVNIFKESGLLKNCWHILNGKASMYKLKTGGAAY